MPDETIRFDDGAAYELMMGRWSALAGAQFLDWIAAPPGARWLDVGCGNGAFTEAIVERCAPADVQAVEPSEGQLAYARTRLPSGAPVTWMQGDAMRLPVPDGERDVAVMALVLFFVPDPALGVAEMHRAVRPGGIVAAYHWDVLGGGFPLVDVAEELKALGVAPRMPPSVEASTLEASRALWQSAGLRNVRTCEIAVRRGFPSFDDYWRSVEPSNTLSPMFSLEPEQRDALKENVRRRLRAVDGSFEVSARANAVYGEKAHAA